MFNSLLTVWMECVINLEVSRLDIFKFYSLRPFGQKGRRLFLISSFISTSTTCCSGYSILLPPKEFGLQLLLLIMTTKKTNQAAKLWLYDASQGWFLSDDEQMLNSQFAGLPTAFMPTRGSSISKNSWKIGDFWGNITKLLVFQSSLNTNTLFEIFIFLSKNSTLISRENCRFFGWKTREKVVVLDFLAVK